MKVQLQSRSMRVRIDEAELGELLAGATLDLHVGTAGQPLLALRVELADALTLQHDHGWQLRLPSTEVHTYVDGLPRRDALVLQVEGEGSAALRIEFEVDVRDSVKVRGARPTSR
jgi:hypothetical protein